MKFKTDLNLSLGIVATVRYNYLSLVSEYRTVIFFTFDDVLGIKETSPLEPGAVEYKYFAPGVGIIQDGPLKLESHT